MDPFKSSKEDTSVNGKGYKTSDLGGSVAPQRSWFSASGESIKGVAGGSYNYNVFTGGGSLARCRYYS